jgi:hypothetical protein
MLICVVSLQLHDVWYVVHQVNSKAKAKRRGVCDRLSIEADLVFGTLETAKELPFSGPHCARFVLIDEAGQGTEPYCMCPISKLAFDGHLVMIGDHKQLAPTVFSPFTKWQGLDSSLFERLCRSPGLDAIVLQVQYRMIPSICCFPSEVTVF